MPSHEFLRPRFEPHRAQPARYAVDLPRAVAAAVACWETFERQIPLEALLEAASGQLRSAVERGEPPNLDLSGPVLATLRCRVALERPQDVVGLGASASRRAA